MIELGLPVPKKIVNVLEQLRKNDENDDAKKQGK